jgi:hypothetical protein
MIVEDRELLWRSLFDDRPALNERKLNICDGCAERRHTGDHDLDLDLEVLFARVSLEEQIDISDHRQLEHSSRSESKMRVWFTGMDDESELWRQIQRQ